MARLSRLVRQPASLGVLALFALSPAMAGQVGTVLDEQKISYPSDGFGYSVSSLGDLDGDGIGDLAVGAYTDNDGGMWQGAVWILFLNTDGTVQSEQKISETEGGFGGDLDPRDHFGSSVSSLGDLDGDGVGDLAVGVWLDDDGGTDQGAVWILFLNADGTVQSEQKISETEGGFGGVLSIADGFGRSVSSLGDLDGDGIGELAVGAIADDDGGSNQGAVWILFLNADGTVQSEQKISETEGGFGGGLDPGDLFGYSFSSLGDLDGDGIGDLAVGVLADDDGGTDQGAVWILFLNADGTVQSEQKISDTVGGFGGGLDPNDWFGRCVSSLGDLNGDGTVDLAVGAPLDDDGGTDRGAVWILFLNADGTVQSERKISDTVGGFGGILDDSARFGSSVSLLGDLNGDGIVDLAVGAYFQIAVWILFLEGADTTPPPHRQRRHPVTWPTPVFVPSTASSDGPRTLPKPDGVSLRNGSGVNESCLSSANAPRAGQEWQTRIDLSAHPGASASLVIVSDRPIRGTPSPFGELLVDIGLRKPLFTSFVVSHGETHLHEILIPAQFLGQSFSLQALIFDGRESVLTNALDVVIGREP